jgi:hypothetical protein
MSETKNKGGWQRPARHLLAVASLLTFAHAASAQVLPGPGAIPFVSQDARDRWQRYVLAKPHKAYAVSETGAWSWKQGFASEEEAKAAALGECERYGAPCFLYAVNHSIVWDKGKLAQPPKHEFPTADALPHVDQAAKDKWQAYVDASGHKAYAIAEDGFWAWKSGANNEEIAKATALNACESKTFPCYLYAVNGLLVWDKAKLGEALKGRVSPLEGTQLVVGRSTFAVPEGAWIVGSSQNRPGGDTSNPVVEAYGHLFGPDGQFKAAFFHSASRAASVNPDAAKGPAWTDGACNRTDAIVADPMHTDARSPECLLLDFVTTPDAAAGYDGKIWRWVRANGVEVRTPIISSTYVKYSGPDFVRIVYWMNPAALRVSSLTQSDPSDSNWNPRHLDARFVERLKAWSYGMAESGRASLEAGVPKVDALPAFPVPDQ